MTSFEAARRAAPGLGLRLAARELRGGFAGFRVFLACLALGVGAIAGVGSLSEAVTRGLEAQGRALLGGDVELGLSMRPASADERAYLTAAGRVSETVTMHAMAAAAGGGGAAFVHVKAVDGAYPLFGAVRLEPAMPLAEALATRDGVPGLVAEPVLLERLTLAVGERLRLGDRVFEVRAGLKREPDRIAGGINFGPQLMIAQTDLAGTGLVQPGSLVRYNYRVALPPGTDGAAWTERLRADLPRAGWRIRDSGNPQPALKRIIDRLAAFLTLVGLAVLLIGGLGVAGAVRAYLESRTESIATLKCLGATGGMIFRIYCAEVAALAGLGILLGLALGALVPVAAAGFIGERLPGAVAIGLYPKPLLLAAAFGLLTAFAFALWPLARARETPAASLFRDLVAPETRWPRLPFVLLIGAAGAALAGLAVASVEDRAVALWFVAGTLIALVILRAAAGGLKRLARAAPRPRRPALRMALGNLHRPGAPTGATMLALGMGLTLVVTVGQVEGNIAREVEALIAEEAPAFYFIDIQPDQVAAFEETVTGVPGVGRFQRVPHLRGRIARINGVPIEEVRVGASARWATASDRGLTYAAAPPPGTRVVAGAWWPADYRGPPLVSFDAHVAHGLGLGVGDTVTINVLGRDVEARVANLREIDWGTLGINFAIVFAPGALEAAPQTHIATVHAPSAAGEALFAAVTARFPNVTAISVREVLDSVARLLAQIGAAARAVAGLALVASALVVGGAVAASRRQRIYDAVVLKVLGATRGDIAAAFLAEFALLGLATGVAAAALGALGGYLIVTQVMNAAWRFAPAAALADIAICLALALVIGFAGTWRALGRQSAPVLRHD